MEPSEYENKISSSLRNFQNYTKKYSNFLKFNNYKKVVDVGCGPGNLTVKALLPVLPKNYEKLVGIDISKEMINHANAHHKIDENIEFREMDIATPDLPKDFQNEFDFIFSNFCMQWVPNIKQSFQNMYDMLKPGGEIFILFFCKALIFEIPITLRQTEKFGSYFKNLETMFTPAAFSERPNEFVRDVLTGVGFNVQFCDLHEESTNYTKEIIKALVHALNSFNMPQDLADEFICIFVDHLRQAGDPIKSSDGEEIFKSNYTLLVAHAKK